MTLTEAIDLVATRQLKEAMLRHGDYIARVYWVGELLRIDLRHDPPADDLSR